jgi:transposase
MKIDGRKMSTEAQARLRERAVRSVLSGQRRVAVARTLGLHRQVVDRWVKDYRKHGEAVFVAGKRGRRGGHGKLKGWQAATICNLLRDHTPDQLKFKFMLWTSEAVRALVFRKFRIKLSPSARQRYLKRWGLTPQKPAKVARERNPEAVRRWLEEEYPAIRREAKALRATLLWGDAMGVRSDHVSGRSYSLRGVTPVIASPGKRFGTNMFSAISNSGKLHFMLFDGEFDAGVFIRFLRRLCRQLRRRIILIVDNHRVHHSKKVRAWLKSMRGKIELRFLPAYSPDLNPDEMLNQDVKANAVGRNRPRSPGVMKLRLRNYLGRRSSDPEAVRRYFQAEHVRYAAA